MNLRLALSLFCILALSPACRADLVIVAPSPANHIPIAYGADGDFVVLSPDPVIYQPAGGASSQLLQLALENEFGTSAGWRFTLASALNGTLNVDNYVATMFSPHFGGVVFSARYNQAPGDEPVDVAKLRWVQLIDSNSPIGPSNPSVDPPVGATERDDKPFYYSELTQMSHSFDATPLIFGNYDLWLFDRPRRNCRNHPDVNRWRATSFLVSWDAVGAGGDVAIHDGIQWGFDFVCVPQNVPEPSTCLLVASAFAGLFGCTRQRRRQAIFA